MGFNSGFKGLNTTIYKENKYNVRDVYELKGLSCEKENWEYYKKLKLDTKSVGLLGKVKLIR